MNCEMLNARLDLLMDGELTDDQIREMEAHGRECPKCAEALRQATRLKALLKQMEPEVDVPLAAQAKWRGAVRDAARHSRVKRLYRWIGSAAAAIVVLVGVGVMMNKNVAPRQDAQRAPAVLESAAESEQADETKDVAYEAKAPVAPLMRAPESAGAVSESAEVAVESAEVATESAVNAAEYAADEEPAEDAVIEADGAVADAEDDLAEFEASADAGMCAAVAQKTATFEATLRVKDVDAACRQITDLAKEYEGEADVRRLENGGASVYLTLDAANAPDFAGAIAPLSVDTQPLELPALADGERLQIILTIVGE